MDLEARRPGLKDAMKVSVLRWLMLLAAVSPAVLVGALSISGGPARLPYFTSPGLEGTMSAAQLKRLMAAFPPQVFAFAALSMLLALFIHLIFTGGILAWFAQPESPGTRRQLWRMVWREGARRFGAMVGVVFRATVVSIVGFALLKSIFGRISDYGEGADWDAHRLWIVLPGLQTVLVLLWFTLVGAWAFWCRWLLVADRRRIFRRTAWLAVRIWFRFPLRAPFPYLAVSLLFAFLPGIVLLLLTRFDTTGLLVQLIVWLTLTLLHSFAWTALVLWARNLYERDRLQDLRQSPDVPWHIFRRLRDRLSATVQRFRATPPAIES